MSVSKASKRSSQSVLKRAVKNATNRNKNFIKLPADENEYETKDVKTQVFQHSDEELRGVVYLNHIPPGFFEKEMRQYFNQFGHVTRLKLARSEKTGESKGYAFIEFRYSEVAKVVAETMNNYLMRNRLLKAKYLDKKFPTKFWNRRTTPNSCRRAVNRKRDTACKNTLLSPIQTIQHAKKGQQKLELLLTRLKEQGVDYDFQPTDVPDSLDTPVLEIDESDDEIDFQTPPNVIKRVLKRQSPSTEADAPRAKKWKENVPKKTSKLPKRSKKTLPKASAKLQIATTRKTIKTAPTPLISERKVKMAKNIQPPSKGVRKAIKAKCVQSPSKDSQKVKKARTVKSPLSNATKGNKGKRVQSPSKDVTKVVKVRSVKSPLSDTAKAKRAKSVKPNALKVQVINVKPSKIPKRSKKNKTVTSPSKISLQISPKKKDIKVKKQSPKKDTATKFKFSVGAHAKNAMPSSKKLEKKSKSPQLKKSPSLKIKTVKTTQKTFIKPKGKVVISSKVVKKSSPSKLASVKSKKMTTKIIKTKFFPTISELKHPTKKKTTK